MHSARRTNQDRTFLQRHGLGIASLLLLTLWVVLYFPANPNTHAGAFYGNAIADWSGTVVTVFATKYLYEIGSAESMSPHGRHSKRRWRRLLRLHSLTVFLAITGIFWLVLYIRMDNNSKWGQVVGNVLSEWTQVLGLVILTKRLIEQGSIESN